MTVRKPQRLVFRTDHREEIGTTHFDVDVRADQAWICRSGDVTGSAGTQSFRASFFHGSYVEFLRALTRSTKPTRAPPPPHQRTYLPTRTPPLSSHYLLSVDRRRPCSPPVVSPNSVRKSCRLSSILRIEVSFTLFAKAERKTPKKPLHGLDGSAATICP